MLIRYSIENFLSFKGRESLSLIPGKSTRKENHINKEIEGIKTLKTSLIFGANASGKSNLIKAISFGKRFVLDGPKVDNGIIYHPHKLDKLLENENSRMEYEIQHKGKNYAYGFVFNLQGIVEEWLYEFNKKKDTKIFERKLENGKVIFDLEYLYKKNKNEDEKQFLDFISKGTPINTLFITEIKKRRVKENVSDISDIFNIIDWFQYVLNIIFPNTKYNEGMFSMLPIDGAMKSKFVDLLKYFDTGIDEIDFVPVNLNTLPLPTEIYENIKKSLNISDNLPISKKNSANVMLTFNNNYYFFKKNKSEITVHKLMTKHRLVGEKGYVFFDINQESDGTKRVIDYIPFILDLIKGDKVFIVDEIERSLHPNLCYELLELFLSKSVGNNCQFISSTHESSLLTQDLVRKDEIWFTVKGNSGASHLHSLSDYSIRFDKNIRKDYLLGRFKAIPNISNIDDLNL